jgi:hypothetical protein
MPPQEQGNLGKKSFMYVMYPVKVNIMLNEPYKPLFFVRLMINSNASSNSEKGTITEMIAARLSGICAVIIDCLKTFRFNNLLTEVYTKRKIKKSLVSWETVFS